MEKDGASPHGCNHTLWDGKSRRNPIHPGSKLLSPENTASGGVSWNCKKVRVKICPNFSTE
jgi:hypothetical protein